MGTPVNIKSNILVWAIERAGYDLKAFLEKKKNSNVAKWIEGTKTPTVKQLQQFSKQVYIPFGYLLLNEPIKEQWPIPFFRTHQSSDGPA